jgi:pSer/pThr/pTyr-binding forkhead associated (FHA) protein
MAVRLVVRAPIAGDAVAGPAWEFEQTRVLIGRAAAADVRLPHPAVSEQHALLRLEGNAYVLVDEGATNGTRVNGARLVPGRAKALRTGDVIEVGHFALVFHAGVATSAPTSTEQTAALARRLVREVLDPRGTASAPPRLVVVGGPQAGTALTLPQPPARLLVGRGESCDLVLADADCSREHLELVCDLDGTLARDLGSKNGVRLNDRLLRERRLRDRDELLVGQTLLVYEDPADAALRALEGQPDAPMPAAALASAAEADASGADAPASPHAANTAPSLESSAPAAPPVDAASPPAVSSAPSAVSPLPAAPPFRERRRRSGASVDLIVYGLAGLVLAASAVALFLLLRAG